MFCGFTKRRIFVVTKYEILKIQTMLIRKSEHVCRIYERRKTIMLTEIIASNLIISLIYCSIIYIN